MYRIGEFSKITNLSIRTLRYYNDIGLLIPEEVDLFTNYRYYGKRNLEDVKIIKELKSIDIDADTRNREISFMEYEVNEIESAGLKEKEDEQLEVQFKAMSNSQKIMESIDTAYNCFDGDNENTRDLQLLFMWLIKRNILNI